MDIISYLLKADDDDLNGLVSYKAMRHILVIVTCPSGRSIRHLRRSQILCLINKFLWSKIGALLIKVYLTKFWFWYGYVYRFPSQTDHVGTMAINIGCMRVMGSVQVYFFGHSTSTLLFATIVLVLDRL